MDKVQITHVRSEEVYVANHGAVCPACDSELLDKDPSFDVGAFTAIIDVKCQECGSTWSDVYELTGYDYFEQGEGVEIVEDN